MLYYVMIVGCAILSLYSGDAVQVTDGCGPGWVYLNSTCYYVSLVSANWSTAHTYCSENGSTLLSSKFEEPMETLWNMTRPHSWWIDRRTSLNKGVWKWLDSASVFSSQLTPWDRSESTDGEDTRDCAEMDYSGLLNDVQCNSSLPFVCEKPLFDVEKNPNHCDPLELYNLTAGCYTISTHAISWWQAQETCYKKGGNLLSITFLDELTDMQMWLREKSKRWWVGLKRISPRVNEWSWLDSDVNFSSLVTPWATNEPNDWEGKEDCVEISPRGQLNDQSCYSTLHFICEKSSGTTTEYGAEGCGVDWFLFNRRCYHLSTNTQSWLNASKICQGKGAKLLSINYLEELELIRKEIRKRSERWWVGLRKISATNSSSHDRTECCCEEMTRGGHLNYADCRDSRPFICEKQIRAKCPAGSVWKSSDAGGQCEECSKGTYQTMGSSSQCMPCPAGHFQDQTGQVNCTVCPAGHFQDQTGQVSCASCTVGHFQDRTGQVSCSACPAGYFQNRTGQLSCTSCPVGYFQNQTGHNICTSCPAGHFQNQTGQLSCIMCPAGHFQDRTGQVSCNSCPAGQVQAQNGQVSCTSCPKGHFQNQTGQVSCTSCPVGHSQDKTGQVSCTSCPAGHFQNRTGQVSCTSCPVGHSQDKTGQVTCIICPVGQFQDRTGQVSCTSCPAGQVQDQTGQVSCNLCPNGHFQEQTEQVSCTTCPAGHFQDRVGQATCNSCPPGHFQNRTGQVRCTSCPPGHFQNRTGQVNCTSCPVDTYQESSGQPACITCPEGEVQPVPGSTACRECPAGEFQTHDTQRAGQRICSVCQPGSYQDQPAQVSCKTCPDGTSTSNAAAKHLDDCTASPNASYTVAVVMTYTLTVECTDEKANEVKLAIVTQIRDHKGALSDVCLGVTCSNAVVNAWCHQVHSIESKVEFMYLTKYEIESSNDTADINMTSFEEKLQDKINESQIFQTISVAHVTLDSLSVEKRVEGVCGPGFQFSSLLNACEAMDTPEQKVGVIVGCVIAFIAVLFLSIILFKLSRRFYPAHQLLGKGDKVIFPESQAQEMKSVSGEMLEEIPGEKIEGDHYEHIKEPESVHYDIVAST